MTCGVAAAVALAALASPAIAARTRCDNRKNRLASLVDAAVLLSSSGWGVVSDHGPRARDNHSFLYLIDRTAPVDFRAVANRHAEPFRAFPEWELRLLVPEHLSESATVFESAARQETANAPGR